MQDCQSELWIAFIKETDVLIDEMREKINKVADEQEALNYIFRAFHTLKSNSLLFEFNNMSSTAALGERVCSLVLNEHGAVSESILSVIYEIFEHACYLYDGIKNDKSEQSNDDLDEIKINKILDNELNDCSERLASTDSDAVMLAGILRENLAVSLGQTATENSDAAKNSIILIKETASLLDHHALYEVYDEAYQLLTNGSTANEIGWLKMISSLINSVEKHEILTGMDCGLEYTLALLRVSYEEYYIDTDRSVIELLNSISNEEVKNISEMSFLCQFEKLGEGVERLGYLHRIYGAECALYLSTFVALLIEFCIFHLDEINESVLQDIILACHKLLISSTKQEINNCEIRECMQNLKEYVPDPNLLSFDKCVLACEQIQDSGIKV